VKSLDALSDYSEPSRFSFFQRFQQNYVHYNIKLCKKLKQFTHYLSETQKTTQVTGGGLNLGYMSLSMHGRNYLN